MAGLERLSTALQRAVSLLDIEARMRADAAMRAWPAVVGPLCAAKTQPFLVHEGVMVVKVASSAWANQLNLLKTQYLAALAERVGPGIITDLRWRVGLTDTESAAAPPPEPAIDEGPLPLSQITLSDADNTSILKQVASIPDPRVAQRVKRTLATLTRRQTWLKQQGLTACTRCGIYGARIREAKEAHCRLCRLREETASPQP